MEIWLASRFSYPFPTPKMDSRTINIGTRDLAIQMAFPCILYQCLSIFAFELLFFFVNNVFSNEENLLQVTLKSYTFV